MGSTHIVPKGVVPVALIGRKDNRVGRLRIAVSCIGWLLLFLFLFLLACGSNDDDTDISAIWNDIDGRHCDSATTNIAVVNANIELRTPTLLLLINTIK